MSERGVQAQKQSLGSAEIGKVVLGAVAGIVGGLVGGWVAFGSPVTALLGMFAGAVAGLIGAARSLEQDQP